MAIRLISEDERFQVELYGCTFHYRRLPPDEAKRIREKYTVRGKIDTDRVAEEAVKYCILGWDGVTDKAGEPAPFSSELVLKLPNAVIVALTDVITNSTAGEDPSKDPS